MIVKIPKKGIRFECENWRGIYVLSAADEEAESTEHFLCECPAYGRIRHQIFGADVLQLRQVASHPLTEILRYVNESGIFR